MKKYLILSILLSSFSFLASASVKDSLGIEKKGDKYFVKHQMEAGETLYALSKRYDASVADIKAANPGVNINDISIGQVIFVPAKNYKEKPASSSPANSTSKTHKVQPKETLYALSRKYDVSVEELKKANPELAEKGLQIGMELVIPGKGTAAPVVAKNEEPKTVPVKSESKPVPANTAAANTQTQTTSSVPAAVRTEPAPKKATAPSELPRSNERIEKITENGIAEVAPQKPDSPDFYAFHKTAPVGTIIQVVNQENGQVAYVRVIGQLTTASSETILVQLSPKAINRLGVKDQKVKVALSYFMP